MIARVRHWCRERVFLEDYLLSVTAARTQGLDRLTTQAVEHAGELEQLRAALDAAERRARTAEDQAAAARFYMERLLEPDQDSRCSKVRLRSRDEAAEFARKVEQEVGTGRLEPIKCMLCPRQPLTMARFWHVRHADPGLRDRRWYPRADGQLQRRVAPATIAALRQRAAQADDTARGG